VQFLAARKFAAARGWCARVRLHSASSRYAPPSTEVNVTGVAGIGRDITSLKKIEKDLREARDYTRGLIEFSIDAMVVIDRDLRITDGLRPRLARRQRPGNSGFLAHQLRTHTDGH
jgi:PAS domain-containing protein